MPLLEAARRRCPILALESPVLLEVIDDGAEWYGDPPQAEPFGRFRDPQRRQELTHKALQRLARFNWGRTAQQTVESYQKALTGEGDAATASL